MTELTRAYHVIGKCQPYCDWNNFNINSCGPNGFEATCTACNHRYDINTVCNSHSHTLFLTLMRRIWELEVMLKDEEE